MYLNFKIKKNLFIQVIILIILIRFYCSNISFFYKIIILYQKSRTIFIYFYILFLYFYISIKLFIKNY